MKESTIDMWARSLNMHELEYGKIYCISTFSQYHYLFIENEYDNVWKMWSENCKTKKVNVITTGPFHDVIYRADLYLRWVKKCFHEKDKELQIKEEEKRIGQERKVEELRIKQEKKLLREKEKEEIYQIQKKQLTFFNFGGY